jgi:hypothetical protein
MTLQKFYYISNDGIALDDFGNEILDEQKKNIIVPLEDRHFYDIAFRPKENPEDHPE